MAHIAPLMGMLLIMSMVTSFKDVEALPVVLKNGASVAVGGPAAPVTSMFSCAGSLQTDFQFGAPFKPEVEVLLNGAFPCPEHCAQFAGFLRQQLQQWSNGNSLSQWNHRNAAFRRHQVGSVLLFSHYRAIRGELTSSAAAVAGGVGGAPGGVALVGAPNGAHHHPDCNHNLAVLQRIEALLKDPHFEEELFVSVPYVAHIPHPVASPPVAVAVESTPVVKVVPPPPPPPPAVTVVASPPVVSLSCSAELVGKVLQVQTPLFPPVAAYLDGLSPEGCRAFQSGLQSALATNGMHLPSTTTPTTTNYIPNFAGRATVIIAGEGSNGAALPPGRETDESLKLITVQAVLRLLYACAKGRRGGLQVQPVHQEVHHAQPVQQVRQVQHVQPVQHVKEVHHVHHVQPVQQVHHQIVQQPLQQQREQVVMIQPNSNPSADVVTVVHSRSASLTGLDASSGAGVAGAGFPGNCHDVFATELLLGEIFSGRTAVSHSPPPPSPVVDTSSKVVVVSTAAGGPSNGASYVSAPVHTDTSKVIVSSGGGGGQIVNSGSTSDTKIIVSGGGGGGGQIVNPGSTDTKVIVTGGNSNGPIVSSGTENKVIVSGGSRYFEPGSGAAISSISNSNNGFGTGGSNVHYVSSSNNYGGYQQGYDRGPVYSAGYPNSVGYENGGTHYGVSEYGGGGSYGENYGASIGSSGSSYGLGANRISSNDGRYYSSPNGFNSAGNPHFSAGSYSGGQNGQLAGNNFAPASGGYGMSNRFGHSAVGGASSYGSNNFGGSNTYGGSFGGNGGNYGASGSSAIGGYNGVSSGLSGTGAGVANYGGQGYSLDANGLAPNGGNLAGGLNGGAASSALGAAGGLAGLNSGNAALGSSLGAATGLVGNVAGTGNGVGNIAGQVLGTGTNSANGVLGSSLGAVTGLLNNVAGSGGAVSGQVLGAGANAANSGVATGTSLGSSVGGNAPSAGSAGGNSGGGASASASA